jgi:hypothetical protein
LNGTAITDDQYTAIYDTTDETSLGYRVDQLVQLTAQTFSCADPKACTNKELTLMQWATGIVTMTQPDSLKGNKFLGTADKCLNNAWGAQTFNCPEFVHYAPDPTNYNTANAALLFSSERGINLDDEVVATTVASFVAQNQESSASIA